MASNRKNRRPSEETQNEALQMARATQRPGQTKEQTKLIAAGIQKGIDQYKKQHKAKLREMDKRRKKTQLNRQPANGATTQRLEPVPSHQNQSAPLPWILLILSWILFAGYLLIRP
jgi:hypothetical protein